MTVYYVVAKGGDDTGSGSEAQPWGSLGRANRTATRGDTVVVAPGTYHEVLRIATPGVIWQSVTPGSAVIDGYYSRQYLKGNGPQMSVSPLNGGGSRDFLPRIASLNAYNSLVEISGDGVVFDGFAVVNSAQIGVTITGGNVVVRNCTIDFCRAQGVRIVPPGYKTGIVLEGCHISHTVIRRRDGYGPVGGAAVMVTTADGAMIRKNVIGPSCGDGVIVNDTARNTVVADNTVFCELMDEGSSGATFERNLVCGLPPGKYYNTGFLGLLMSFEREGSKPFRPITTRVVNNVFVNCGTLWVIRNSDKTDTQLDGARIAHNTFVVGPDTKRMISIPVNVSGRKHRNSVIENNVFYGSIPSAVGSGMLAQCTLRRNAWTNQPVAALRGIDDIVAANLGLYDPQAEVVVIGSGYDLEAAIVVYDNYGPVADSPLVDSALPSDVTTDMTGLSRRGQGDIGAIEFRTAPMPEPEPEPDGIDELVFSNDWAIVVDTGVLRIRKDDGSLWDFDLTAV